MLRLTIHSTVTLLCLFLFYCTSHPAAAITFNISPNPQVHLSEDETFTVPGKNPLNFCADPRDYILNIDHVDLSPNPPQAGQFLTIQASGNVTQTVRRGAHALISVKLRLNYGGQIPILQRDEDLCDLIERDDDFKQKCPLNKDENVSFTKKVNIPERVPKGKFQLLVDALTEKQEKITCLTTEIEF